MEKEARPVLTRRIQALVIVLLSGTLAACSASRPIKYYVIDVGPAPASVSASPLPISLLVARVTASHLYRDDRVVFADGPLQLGTYEYERWGASPADMMQDVLISSLRATGQYRTISRIGSTVKGDYILRGHLNALDEVDKPALAGRFSFELELFDPKSGTTIWSDSYMHEEPVNGKKAKVADVVEALDRSVRMGMNQMTSNLGQYFATHPPAGQ
jgi:ABC-type uncharacterized transport system auxiliary subunit